MEKREALIKVLELNEEEANEVQDSAYANETFEANGGEYLVLTEDEADERAKESIMETLWAFNWSFLASHSDAILEMGEEAFRPIQEQCESANKAIECMIDDIDHFIDDAIRADGRGHFLAGYDGEELEACNGSNVEYFIYRTN